MELFILTAVIVLLCVAATGIRIWIKGEFAQTEIGRNKNMQNLGIVCAKDEEIGMLKGEKTKPFDCGSCTVCRDMKRSK